VFVATLLIAALLARTVSVIPAGEASPAESAVLPAVTASIALGSEHATKVESASVLLRLYRFEREPIRSPVLHWKGLGHVSASSLDAGRAAGRGGSWKIVPVPPQIEGIVTRIAPSRVTEDASTKPRRGQTWRH
jgi:hypothetical protein